MVWVCAGMSMVQVCVFEHNLWYPFNSSSCRRFIAPRSWPKGDFEFQFLEEASVLLSSTQGAVSFQIKFHLTLLLEVMPPHAMNKSNNNNNNNKENNNNTTMNNISITIPQWLLLLVVRPWRTCVLRCLVIDVVVLLLLFPTLEFFVKTMCGVSLELFCSGGPPRLRAITC